MTRRFVDKDRTSAVFLKQSVMSVIPSSSKKIRSNGTTPYGYEKRAFGRSYSPHISPDIKPDGSIFDYSGFNQKRSSNSKQRIPESVKTPGTPSKRLKTPSVSRISSESSIDMLYTPYAHFLSPEENFGVEELSSDTIETDSVASQVTNNGTIMERGIDSLRTSRLWTPRSLRKSSRSETSENYLTKTFEVLEKIGSGSFADVFKVSERTTGHLFAVKKTRQPFVGFKDRLMKLAEVQKLGLLGDHPHCVRLFDAWEQNGHLYMQTELCEQGR
jgi:hypothetical protein